MLHILLNAFVIYLFLKIERFLQLAYSRGQIFNTFEPPPLRKISETGAVC